MRNRALLLVIILAIIVAAVFLIPKIGKNITSAIHNSSSKSLYAQAIELKSKGETAQAIEVLNKLVTDFPKAKNIIEVSMMLAELYEGGNDFIQAKAVYEKLIADNANNPSIGTVQKKLWDLNIKILFSPAKSADSTVYEVKPGDSLFKIAQKFNTTVEMLKKSNNINNNWIKPGQSLKIVTATFSILVDKSLNILTLKSNGEVIKIYTVATGLNNSTPVGTFKITNKLIDPPWYKTGAIIPPKSPENILGTRWMGIDKPGYGIHGTTIPESIGKQTTAGCVRMLNAEVEELFAIVPVGTEVVIQD